jgi:methylmalonyl-CoA mutase
LWATTAAFGAAVGGADSITVVADSNSGALLTPRLARNVQSILAQEAHLFRVADPAAGSGAVESLTAMLADKAWAELQVIESEGGIVSYAAGGALRQRLATARTARASPGTMPLADMARSGR